MKKSLFPSFIAFFFGLALVAEANSEKASWPEGPSADLKFETSSFMKSTLDAKPGSLSGDASQSGAYGPYNKAFEAGKGKEWYIESQRFGVDALMAGLAWDRRDLIDKGIRILDWGFAHENADGSFDCPDTFHSTAFFVEAAARTALLLEASQYKDAYSSWIEKAKSKLLLTAHWMAKPSVFDPGTKRDSIYTHRCYLNADALAFAGLLGGDSELVALARKLVREGISRQSPMGFNPEKGGFDTSYHSVGLVFALRYFSIAADQETRATLGPMISRGLSWLKGRIKDDGSVEQTGNTRTGDGQEIGRDKKPKTMSYGSAARAFAYWGLITEDRSDEEIARRVFNHGETHRH